MTRGRRSTRTTSASAEGSGQGVWRQHVPQRRGLAGAGLQARAVQPARGQGGGSRLGRTLVLGDPCQYLLRAEALGEDRGALDDLAARGVRAGEPADRVL